MGLLRFLGIEKYLKKVKTYVDEKDGELLEKIDNLQPSSSVNETVMKYLADPYVINSNIALPEDLRELIITGGVPNKNIFKLCLLNVDKDGDGEYWLEAIVSSIDDIIVSTSGKYFFYENDMFITK